MKAPDDFAPIFRTSPFLESLGTFYSKGTGADMRLGVYVETRATNARGLAHGGFLAGLADVALGYAMSTSQEPPTRLITSSLSLDFAGAAKIGDWIETTVDLQHLGRQLGFANAYLTVDARRIVRASGVFVRADASAAKNS
jgi:uncharacterized protein (TIGR00369 family)